MRKRSKKPLFLVVPAKVQDLMDIQRLHDDCFPDTPRTLKWWMVKLGEETSKYCCYCCKIAGTDTVTGFLLAKMSDRGYADITALGVSVMYRRQGIGRLLLAQFIEEAGDMVSEVVAYIPDCSDYLPAQLFLKECGFPDSRIDKKKQAIKFQRTLV